MGYMLACIWQAQLCALATTAAIVIAPVLCANLHSYVNYVCWTYPYVLYYGVIILWCAVCVVYNAGVAHATGEINLFVNWFIKYPCKGISLYRTGVHELHQHSYHMAGWSASSLPKAGYYYVPLNQTNIKFEGDAVLFNPVTNHGVLIQNKAAVEVLADYGKMEKWLTDYKGNTQLLCYGIYEQSWHDSLVKEVFTPLLGEFKQGNLQVDCISIVMDTKLAQGTTSALELEEAIAMHSYMLDMSTYNKFTAAYYNSLLKPELVKADALTDAQVIKEFTRGLSAVVGNKKVALLSEM